MPARIYKPARNAMQSGTAGTDCWVLDFAPAEARSRDPLMGWTSSGDTQSQVRLRFETLEQAKAYAEKHGIAYRVRTAKPRKPNIRPGGYGDNFAHNRRSGWTH
ncbi:ETC complex I subunit [Rhodobacteraceae bacterium 2CG4]|uniref:ETC complex I subunit n=1 Tax=Halovulum marinum TaxID=2662447 RepID=A0A6L5Z6N7_9RHOB|nr:ETC complex I subunit [Halovulum marinum]MSU92213.1 ETC complex I subunit [Halovulum marinum]